MERWKHGKMERWKNGKFDSSKLQQAHVNKIRRLLARLHAATVLEDMQFPGEILKEDYLVPLGLTITKASVSLDIARKNLSAIVNGRAGISPSMAIRLSMAFGTSPEFWLNLQSTYNLWLASQENKDLRIKRLS